VEQIRKPKVSIIVPTYRRNETLRRALCSLLNQTYSNIEIVVVNDNGNLSDYKYEARNIVKEITDSTDNIIYIENDKNIGAAKSRNIGLENSSGEFITFLDDDDIYTVHKIERQIHYMLRNHIEMCFTDLQLNNKHDRMVDFRERGYIKSYDTNSLIRYHLLYHITGTDTFMYRRELIDKIGGFDPIDIGDEFYLMLKTIKSGAKIGYLKGSDVIAYVHGSEGGLSTGEEKIDGENRLYEFKKPYFDLLSGKDIKYIKFRHYATLAYVEFKRKNYFIALKNALCSFKSSPKNVLKECLERL
jgi:glycosyltransferase involved in cell wall biosynthesis